MTAAPLVGLPLALALVSIALPWDCVHVVTASSTPHSEEVTIFQVGSNESLTAALEAIQGSITNGSGGHFELLIPNGTYTLNATRLATFTNVSDIHFIGAEIGPTVIDCEGTAGWVFVTVSNMTIANITFHNCSSLQNSSSTNTSQHEGLSYIEFSSALYLLECSDLQIETVTISNSPGVGLAMFNIRGNNFFSDCTFTNNPPYSERGQVHGAGGVILEFSYCSPGDTSCDSTNVVEVTDASIEFTNCNFEGNIASSVEFVPPPIYPHGTQHWGFGRGGGMAVYFKGRAVNNVVTLKNCYIAWNVADYSGGGLYVEFGDESQNNIFNFSSINGGLSSIETNGHWCGSPSYNQSDKEYSGGGVRVVFMYYPDDDDDVTPSGYQANVTGNQVEFSGTFFANNMACWGGGATVVSSRSDPSTPQTNTVHFRHCTFGNNVAVDGSALAFSVLQPDTPVKSQLLTPLVEECVFQDNIANTRSPDSNPNIAGYEFGIGAMYVSQVPVIFTGANHFISNIGTGLVVCDAHVVISAHSSLQFKGNNGRRGGALIVTGDGSLFVHPGVVLNFTENEAWELGGAIYTVGHFGERQFIYEEKCFVRYYKPTIYPKNWNSRFIFSNNSVAGVSGNGTIYTTSLLSCVWPEEGNMTADIQQALCWPGWVYDGQDGMSTCSRYISTAPASFNNSDMAYQMNVYPGHTAILPVQMRDDNGKIIGPVVFRLMPNSTTAKLADPPVMYVTDNEISLSGVTDDANEDTFFLETLGPRVLSTTLKINIFPCPPGFTPVYSESDSRIVVKCKCGYSMYFTCSSADLSARIRPGYCISYHSNNASCSNTSATQSDSTHHHRMIVVKCPATSQKTQPLSLPKEDTCNFEEHFCAQVHRKGKFCSDCLPGYTADVNNINKCVKCSDEQYHYGWFLYILTNILPITIFFAIVALFKVSATSAPMYAFVFFAQITTVRYFHNQYPWIYGLKEHHTVLRPLLLAPYCIWNLDFFVFNKGICLSPHLTNVGGLLLQYLLAFYPMALILLSYISIELYDRNFKPLVCLWSPFRTCLIKFRRSWQPKTSIIDAFATVLMLSYTKITFTTISLLTPARPYYVHHRNSSLVPGDLLFYFDPQYHYLQGLHLVLGLLALGIGVVFVITPPLFLFLYPTKVFQRCLNKSRRSWQALHTFADAFHGCFKNRTNNNHDYRYFAGLYFVLRIVILLIYVIELQLYLQLLLQQILCILAVLLFALVKPYKEAFFNKVDLVFFTLLSLMNIFGFSNYAYSVINDNETSTALFAITYALGFLPLVYITVYIFYLFLKWRGIIASDPTVRELTAGGGDVSTTADENSGDDVPDRLLNPQNYPNNCTPGSILSVNSGSSNDSGNSQQETKKPRQRATEGSYFLKKARYMKNYSSI